ncbi:hypothetical protein PhaeoP23_03970 (plasmid) [Phaeobacter piscinae]|uniref:NADH:ubiquinone reductase (non-electrogenic) n=1 Tax=Phaeobacter piscinae TaxID=1580596 RepID=A0ABM6PKF8_9RHOB|nr:MULTISPECIES: hypothetical protein [Phaeobacter]ATG38123.1 hypothetical protein PhaeoP36_04048 [Phaeobacter piscinae]AUQ88644.1 hypothetical protein PhaeoP42_04049 [Phaeobacter piscinae]AUQ92643.1 hypothetical protein PhaeoP24_04085 [Phaeobacter inhibens]AUR26449.1 hypothetical protein PhaeoP23_03970 [Phaeobacter piscinae]
MLKSIDDALDIRGRLLASFEKAECSEDPQEIRRLLTFALVGGGPTGIEMSGAIAELALNFVPVPGHRGKVPLSKKGTWNGTIEADVHRRV